MAKQAGSLRVQQLDFQLAGEYVALCDLLKLAGVAVSGGQGKALVASGAVTVDGRHETRKTAKIRAGQIVQCQGVQIRVDPAPAPAPADPGPGGAAGRA